MTEKSPQQSKALRAALRGLQAAVRRHNQDVQRRPPDEDAVYASLVEATWWVASLDGQLLDRAGYQSARVADEDGQYILGLIWARDRHYHQLPFSVLHDTTPFLGSDGVGPPFYISAGTIWLPADQLQEPRERRSPPKSREVYETKMAHRQTSDSLGHALRWFDKLTREPLELLPSWQ